LFLLDTNVVSELRKAAGGKADNRVVAWASATPARLMFVSAITLLELEIGVLRIERRDRQQAKPLRHWLDTQVLPAFAGRVLAVDQAVALACARLQVPDRLAERDALIAATAQVHGLTVATRNTRDFAAAGVAMLDPWRG
jgi:toxin FitB